MVLSSCFSAGHRGCHWDPLGPWGRNSWRVQVSGGWRAWTPATMGPWDFWGRCHQISYADMHVVGALKRYYIIYIHIIYIYISTFKDPQRYFSHFCGKEIVHLRGKKAHTLHGTGMLSPHNWVISGQMMEYLPFSIWSICDGCFDDLDRLFNNKMEHWRFGVIKIFVARIKKGN